MKYSDLYNLKEEILDESYLTSQFKFGFELEGIIDTRKIKSSVDIQKKIELVLNYEMNKLQDISDVDNLEYANERINALKLIIKSCKSLKYDVDIIELYKNILKGNINGPTAKKVVEYCPDETNFIASLDGNLGKKYLSELAEYLDNEFDSKGNMGNDASIESEYDNGLPFEYSSGILDFTPDTLNTMIKVLSNIQREWAVSVNDTCGFHTHISFPNINRNDAIWITCQLALDDAMFDSLVKVGGVDFFGAYYSKPEEMRKLAHILSNKKIYQNDEIDYNAIVYALPSQSKESNINIHNLGTIEWRGPRGFLPEESMRNNPPTPQVNRKNMIPYIKRLWQFIKWIQATLDKKEIILGNSINVSRENFDNGINKELSDNGGSYDISFKNQGIQNRNKEKTNIKREAMKFVKTLDLNIVYKMSDDEFLDFESYVKEFVYNSMKKGKDFAGRDKLDLPSIYRELYKKENEREQPDERVLSMLEDIMYHSFWSLD